MMDRYVEEKIRNQRVSRVRPYGGDRAKALEVHHADHFVSWKKFGKGVSNHRFEANVNGDGVPCISFTISETLLANKNLDAKRDSEKEVYGHLYGPAALELFEMLREVFEPVRPE